MHSPGRLPIHSSPAGPPPKRHHTPRFYAHRVHESLTSRLCKIICAIFLIILFVAGITTFILFLSLRPHRPRFHLQDFSVPGLGQSTGFQNAEIVLNVTARNSNQHIGFYYGAVQSTVYYRDQEIGSTQLLGPFYQEPKNTTVMYGVLSGASLTVNNQRWMEFTSDRGRGNVLFRLDITSTIQFKVSTWKSKNHRMHATCDVSVGQDGMILPSSRAKRCPVYFT